MQATIHTPREAHNLPRAAHTFLEKARHVMCAVHRVECAVHRVECAVHRVECATQLSMFRRHKSDIKRRPPLHAITMGASLPVAKNLA